MSYWEGRKYLYCHIPSSLRTDLLQDCFSELFCDYFVLNKISELLIEGITVEHNKHSYDKEESKKGASIFAYFGEMLNIISNKTNKPVFVLYTDFICYSEIRPWGIFFPYTGISILYVSALLKSIIAFMIRYGVLEVTKHDAIRSVFYYRISDAYLSLWDVYYRQSIVFILCFILRSIYKVDSVIFMETKTTIGIFKLLLPHCKRDARLTAAWNIVQLSIKEKVVNDVTRFYKFVRIKAKQPILYKETITRDSIGRVNVWKNNL